MKKLTLILIFGSISFGLFSQNFEVPKSYILEKAEDYTQYENDVVKCVDWLIANPINEQASKRKEANAFLLKWLMGSPDIYIEIRQEIVTFQNSSPELLSIFMGGWAKYSIENKDFDNKTLGSLAGIESVIEFYTKNKGLISKDKNVEAYVKMKKKGTLKDYIEKNAN